MAFEELLLQGGRADAVVDDRVVIEIKVVEFVLPVHERQLISYLKATGLDVGVLMNFNVALFKSGWKTYDHPRFFVA